MNGNVNKHRVRFLVFLKRNSAKVTGKPVKDVCVGGCVMVSAVGLGVNNNNDKLLYLIEVLTPEKKN